MKWMTYVHSQLVGVVVFAGTAVLFYEWVASMESKGGSFRIHWLGAALYSLGGNVLLTSVMSVLAGLIAWAVWPEPSRD